MISLNSIVVYQIPIYSWKMCDLQTCPRAKFQVTDLQTITLKLNLIKARRWGQ